jgi:hypothetical protein
VIEGDSPANREQVEQVAQLRGVPLTWAQPGIDASQLQAQASDAQLPALAAAVGAQAVLVGVRSGNGFNWTLSHAGQRAERQGQLQDGIHLAADTFAARYAPASTRGTSTVSIRIGGIGDVASYAIVTKYLDSLSLVRSIDVDELAGDVVKLRVALRGDLELLRRIVGLGGPLRASTSDPAATSTVDFTYAP